MYLERADSCGEIVSFRRIGNVPILTSDIEGRAGRRVGGQEQGNGVKAADCAGKET